MESQKDNIINQGISDDKMPLEILVYGKPLYFEDGNVLLTTREEINDLYSKGGRLVVSMLIPDNIK